MSKPRQYRCLHCARVVEGATSAYSATVRCGCPPDPGGPTGYSSSSDSAAAANEKRIVELEAQLELLRRTPDSALMLELEQARAQLARDRDQASGLRGDLARARAERQILQVEVSHLRYKLTLAAFAAAGVRTAEPDLEDDLVEDLIRLVHPDRHPEDRKELAGRVTARVLAKRRPKP